MDEIKVSDEQREKLLEHVMAQIMETGPFLESLPLFRRGTGKKAQRTSKAGSGEAGQILERDSKTGTAQAGAWDHAPARGRLGLGTGRCPRRTEVHSGATEEIHGHLSQALQRKIQALIKEAQAGGKPEELRPTVLKTREEYGKKLEAVLTDEQTKKWKDMLGEPFNLGD